MGPFMGMSDTQLATEYEEPMVVIVDPLGDTSKYWLMDRAEGGLRIFHDKCGRNVYQSLSWVLSVHTINNTVIVHETECTER